jgi:long-chain acyl-CoA synthetase
MDKHPWHSHYDDGVATTIAYEEIALPTILRRTAENSPELPALYWLNARLNYRELARQVARCSAALTRMGVGPGKSVAIQLPNMPQAVIAYYGALSTGARVVLTNPLYTPREIEHQWNDAECQVAITTDFLFAQKIRDNRAALDVEQFVIASIPEYLRFPLNWLAPFKLRNQDPPKIAKIPPEKGVHFFRKFIQEAAPIPPRPIEDLDEIAVLQYTGGTTGVSKGAMLSHRNLSVNAQQCDAWFPRSKAERQVLMTALPLFHVFGMTVCMNWSVTAGGAMVLVLDPRDAASIAKEIVKHRVTIFPGVPAMYNALNNLPGIEAMDVSSIRGCLSGSAPIAREVQERFESLTGAIIVEGFGMSETSPITHANPFGRRKLGSIGVPVPDTEARIVDVDDPSKVLAPGEEGELCVRGPQIMLGYWKRPDETAKTIVDGWLLTGDLGTMDEEGYFRIVGRKKDMINVSGFKVFPDEVDEVLMAYEGVLEAATIGLPDKKRGEMVKSFVVLQNKDVTVEALQAYCREQLAAYKVPREFEFIAELPKSTVLKVLRRELRDRELAKRALA